jgi:hypothetical protein
MPASLYFVLNEETNDLLCIYRARSITEVLERFEADRLGRCRPVIRIVLGTVEWVLGVENGHYVRLDK